jgi:hypothetical protein
MRTTLASLLVDGSWLMVDGAAKRDQPSTINYQLSTILALLLFIGCVSNPQRKTYNSVWTVAVGVNESWKAYVDLVIAGQLPTNDVPKVAEAYNNFQLALKSASIGMMLDTNAPAPPELIATAGAFNKTLNAAKR